MSLTVTIAICTYNRAYYLDKCLAGFNEQIHEVNNVDILIVDNNSSDATYSIFEKYKNMGFPINYVKELKQGLSHARNRAITFNKTVYLGYLDDDGIPQANYLQRLRWIIDTHEPDCFGGMYYPYYEVSKPKWIDEDFGKKKQLSNGFGKAHGGFLSGGNMFFKRAIMSEVGYFDPTRGMIGNKIGYAEEDHYQMRLLDLGFSIYFDPNLSILHLVASYKLNFFWHIKRVFQLNYSTVNLAYKRYTFWYTLKRLIVVTVKTIPKAVWKFLVNRHYYYQNMLIDIFGGYAYALGLYFNNKRR